MLKWIWNMHSIAILLFSRCLFTLKKKIGLQWQVNWALSKTKKKNKTKKKKKISGWIGLVSNPYWDVVQIIQIKCIPIAIQISSNWVLRISSCKICTKSVIQVAKLVIKKKEKISDQNPSCWTNFYFLFFWLSTLFSYHKQVNLGCLINPHP